MSLVRYRNMVLEPNPRQSVKNITLFRCQVLKETLVLQNINFRFMRFCLMRDKMPTPLLVGNVTTVLWETLLNASVQDHRRSDIIYSISCAKTVSALAVLILTDFCQSYSKKWWALKVYILAVKKKKVQNKFWGCSLKVLCLALPVMDREKKNYSFLLWNSLSFCWRLDSDLPRLLSSLLLQSGYHTIPAVCYPSQQNTPVIRAEQNKQALPCVCRGTPHF